MSSVLDSPVEYLKGVGPQRADLLRRELEIATYEDLLYHYPYRYFDRTQIAKIDSIDPTTEYIQIAGKLINIAEEGEGRKKRLTATLYDDTAKIELVWFGNTQWIKKKPERI